jgi:hypothetical protein
MLRPAPRRLAVQAEPNQVTAVCDGGEMGVAAGPTAAVDPVRRAVADQTFDGRGRQPRTMADQAFGRGAGRHLKAPCQCLRRHTHPGPGCTCRHREERALRGIRRALRSALTGAVTSAHHAPPTTQAPTPSPGADTRRRLQARLDPGSGRHTGVVHSNRLEVSGRAECAARPACSRRRSS